MRNVFVPLCLCEQAAPDSLLKLQEAPLESNNFGSVYKVLYDGKICAAKVRLKSDCTTATLLRTAHNRSTALLVRRLRRLCQY